MKNILEGFNITKTGIGKRLVYTYTSLDEKTGAVARGQRENIPVLIDENILGHVKAIEDYIAKDLKEKVGE